MGIKSLSPVGAVLSYFTGISTAAKYFEIVIQDFQLI